MKKILLTILAVPWLTSLRAQVSITPVAGMTISNYVVSNDDGTTFDRVFSSRVGFCGGVLANIPIGRKFSLQPGLTYKMNGYFESGSGETPTGFENFRITQRVSTIDMPCKLTYSFKGKRGNSFFLGAGPYFAVNVASSLQIKSEVIDKAGNVVRSFDVTYYDKIGREDSRTRRFDVGGGIVAGYQFGNGVMFCLQAQRGIKDVLANHFAAQYSSWVAKNYNYGIVGGYTFKMKKHKAHSEEPAGTKQ